MLMRALLFVAVLSSPAIAQQPSQTLTLQDCIRLAEAVPNAVSVAEQGLRIADRDVARTRAGFLPQSEILNGFIYTSPRLDDRSTFSFIPANGIREYAILGTVTQEFDTSGRLRADLQRARAGQDAARVNFEIARRDLRRAVTIAYYRLLLTRHLVAVINESLKESRSFEERTRLLFENGEAARADLVKASAQAAFLQQALNAAELEAKLANQELASFWTKDVDQPLAIADLLDEPAPAPENEAPGNAAPFLRRLEFNRLDAQRRSFQAEAQIARAALKPQFNFVFQYGIDSTAARWRDRGYAAYLNLRIPVFDWFRARSQAAQFQLRAAQVETNRTIAERAFSRDYQKRPHSRSHRHGWQAIRYGHAQTRLVVED
jgi:outer membrane protein TolC